MAYLAGSDWVKRTSVSVVYRLWELRLKYLFSGFLIQLFPTTHQGDLDAILAANGAEAEEGGAPSPRPTAPSAAVRHGATNWFPIENGH